MVIDPGEVKQKGKSISKQIHDFLIENKGKAYSVSEIMATLDRPANIRSVYVYLGNLCREKDVKRGVHNYATCYWVE